MRHRGNADQCAAYETRDVIVDPGHLCIDHIQNGHLDEGGLSSMARGRARWQVMIRRARKHIVKEGLLDSDTGLD